MAHQFGEVGLGGLKDQDQVEVVAHQYIGVNPCVVDL